MPNWEGSNRRERLPTDWASRRARVLRRDGYRCTRLDQDGQRCPQRATDVDHVQHGDNHDESNLTSLCAPHHATKSGREGAEAARAKRRAISKRFRRTEPHPSQHL